MDFKEFSNKLTNDKLVNLGNLIENLNLDDFTNYIDFGESGYKRNLIYRDDLVEVLLICWNKGVETKFHRHPENGCLLKLLQGEINEDVKYNDGTLKENKIQKGDTSYIDDKIGVHKIRNTDTQSISIHFYSPPDFYG